MNETYAEASVKKKETVGTYVLRVVLIAVAVLSFLLMSQSTILLVVSAILIVAIIYLFPRLNVIYEYVYCDGQMDFDKIMGSSKRKTIVKIDFDKVEMMAPQGSHALDGFAHIKCNLKDFTSKDKEVKPHVLIVKENEGVTKILFEPNEKMINIIKTKYPRKISQF